ncbi:PREDICTED: C-type lectin 37Db-like [Nicrophorus vespilloides]|uniref:C-type lectin 37Db-like n=1 Tax=Nicrophorus vespilloides TaxID=110193 RepID=A0ABM1MBX1_NICVS|nr:PREDICTED: C-type lectin 37Db-like [Nicrophorus vespilloides]XP_017772079.1 PREDICTED: C-type lectin 37Db-like [Nicrophorus vespilloides]
MLTTVEISIKTREFPSIHHNVRTMNLTKASDFLLLLLLASTSLSQPTYNRSTYVYKNKVYHIETFFKTTFYSAFMYCNKLGMNLLMITAEDEFDKITDFIKSKVKYEKDLMFWTAGAAVEPKEFHWMYTGLPVELNTRWLQGEPNNLSGSEYCLQLWMNKPSVFVLNDQSCTTKSYFVCQTTN